jgi:hypothetical protein
VGCGRERGQSGSTAAGRWPVGLGSTVPGGAIPNSVWTEQKFKRVQTNFKLLQTILNPNRTFPISKIWNKIKFERIWDKEQLSSQRFPQIQNGYWTKIQRSFYDLNFNRNSLEILETLEFMKFG